MTMTGKLVHEETAEDWDDRFSGGWQKVGGSIQSLLFAFASITRLRPHLEWLSTWKRDENGIVTTRRLTLHEYGCALGDGTALLQAWLPGATIVGFDHSPKAIEIARERWPTLKFRVGDIEEVEPADVIWTSHTIEHLPDPASTINRLLERCGLLVVVVPPLTADGPQGGHEGGVPFNEWISKCPEPVYEETYPTLRMVPQESVGAGEPTAYVEGNCLLVFRNQTYVAQAPTDSSEPPAT